MESAAVHPPSVTALSLMSKLVRITAWTLPAALLGPFTWRAVSAWPSLSVWTMTKTAVRIAGVVGWSVSDLKKDIIINDCPRQERLPRPEVRRERQVLG